MKSRLLVAAVAFLGYAILDATPANAEDMYFAPTGASGDWESNGVWYTDGCDAQVYAGDGNYPDSTETVRICAGKTAGVGTIFSEAKTVYLETIDSDVAYINIDPNGADAKLTLGSGGTCESVLEGDTAIYLVPDATYKAILRFETCEHTVKGHATNGEGDIIGQDNDAELVIDGVTLTSQVDIRGGMHIKDGTSAGTLDNQGRVMADDASGYLDVEPTTIDDTSGSGRWQVTASGAYLRFIVEPQPLDGSFTVSNGTLRAGTDVSADDIDVCTSGDLSHTGGYIKAGVSDSFSFNCASCPCVE